ncbi:nitrogen regulation protein NR(II) [Alkalimonas collagenimarina]|uniref:Sensory histidine kinase/phosphatase NtrB n=1 Tax=Alkalimonas collagenimarina TaxID=400390 RepID=A0ABT9GVH2_9GAMM|nr:nitrogen regulation protein NR(II) [Alkalimonas collagenimarina]MDP4535053.1 nitrogen regulation protein NR(II) [Alkalimonas collagenimarina]
MSELKPSDKTKVAFPAELVSDLLSTAVLILDQQLQISSFNAACSAVLGISEKRLSGQYFPSLFQHCELGKEPLRHAIEQQKSIAISDVQTILHDGHPTLLDFYLTPFNHQQQDYLLLEIRQIDRQRKISQDNVQQHQHHAARELVRNLAHEIKNPLGGLRGAAQLLESSLDEEQREYTQLIIAQADRLRKLVDRLLGPYRPPQQKFANLHQVIEQVYQLAMLDNASAVTMQRDYDPSIPVFRFDPELIEQALLNIVRNAQQALQQGGHILLQSRILYQHTLHGQRHKLVAAIKVIDDGPGIPAEIKDTLFYPMVSGKAGGTGLGLTIAQTLLHQHGGWIDCDSWPGHTEFTLYLPISDTEDAL